MSTLASCGRLPATVPDLANRPRQLVFLTPIDSQLNDFLNEIHQIACFEPPIVERIEEDLDLHAKKKKLLRLVDAQFQAGQTPDLPKLELQLRQLKLDDIQLEEGRPRTEAYVVYVFLMLRGFNGGCKDQQARLLLEESMTLKLWLEHLGLELPPASTLSDNLNAVSNQTRSLIHQAQLRYIFQGGLDDYQKCFIDSTAVEANTERPTDSTFLVRLIARVCTSGGNLHRVDLPDMNPIGLLAQQQELRRMSQQIDFLKGKARAEAKRKKLYFLLLRRVRRLRKRLLRDLESVGRNLACRSDLPPSRRLMAQEVLCLISEDLTALEQAADVCQRRVMEQEKVPVAEKIKEAGTPWWVTGRNWHAVGAVLSRRWCCLVATQPTVRTFLRWSRSRSPTPESLLRWPAPMMVTALSRDERKCWALGSKWLASAEPKARRSSRRKNGRASLTDRRGPSAALWSHWSSL